MITKTEGAISAPAVLDADVLAALVGARVWLTGARGFIGGATALALRAAGVSVEAFTGDIRDGLALRRALAAARPTMVLNLAAVVDARRDLSLETMMEAVNHRGAVAVAEAAAAEVPDCVFVQVGSCEEYGPIPAPFAEDDEPAQPASPYGRAKLAATRALLDRRPLQHLRVARPFLTYGPGPRVSGVLPAAVRAALAKQPFAMTSGAQTREWNHIDDTVRGLLRVATQPGLDGQICNVACGEERRVQDVVELVFEVVGAPQDLIQVGSLPERQGEVPRFFADIRRCRELLGHRPRVPLEAGIRATALLHR